MGNLQKLKQFGGGYSTPNKDDDGLFADVDTINNELEKRLKYLPQAEVPKYNVSAPDIEGMIRAMADDSFKVTEIKSPTAMSEEIKAREPKPVAKKDDSYIVNIVSLLEYGRTLCSDDKQIWTALQTLSLNGKKSQVELEKELTNILLQF